ncbi:sulfur carrier protein ThiS [Nocardioides jishulii]|uniref:Sulfur carrier protein ThiS n=1 Tax=Nocardioides jishulii TaxID=2575440 RepID=A0A4U2YH74_9ACTN|nr:sulfur carrier protein ThiS [Nocardioides jishulii]QCX26701.1 sulfur carrier protein ThiS [Nocardioides jishulii]TKI60329.1 sulfur carrier protein ThiS [Nocardioides jishulii]
MIELNGRPTPAADRTLEEALASLDLPPTGCAVAVNGEVVPRSEHAVHRLRDGDVVEVVTAVQGG